jgi:hypothetical protein
LQNDLPSCNVAAMAVSAPSTGLGPVRAVAAASVPRRGACTPGRFADTPAYVPRHAAPLDSAAPGFLELDGLRAPLPLLVIGTDVQIPITTAPPPDYPYSVDTWETATRNLVTHVPELLADRLICTETACRDLWPCSTARVASGSLLIDLYKIACGALLSSRSAAPARGWRRSLDRWPPP